MTPHDHYVFAEVMRHYGGHFCKKLADAYCAADFANKAKIIEAFPDLFQKYGPDSQFAKIRFTNLQNV